ncbi:hypothetical protein [Arthrobacter sp. UYEF3]|uniref:hypothetical protein n=1 Tax=Arthrobacter sp. UYEF3 TaxID=1756365 RepID=UPI00339487BD
MFSFFGLAILAAIIMFGVRRYNASNRGQNGNGSGSFPGQQNNQPRDGFTQRDYYGGFGQLGAPQPPAKHEFPVPYEDSPEYLNNPPQTGPHAAPRAHYQQPPAQPRPPTAPPVPSSSGSQGYRARKLAELDQKYSNGELAMEDYMAQRAEIMKG